MNPSSAGNSPHEISNRGRNRLGWRFDQPDDSQIAFRRWIRIATVATLIIGAFSLLLWQLFAPFQHNNPHLILISRAPLCSEGENSTSAEAPARRDDFQVSRMPLDFVSNDFSAMKSLNESYLKQIIFETSNSTDHMRVSEKIQQLQPILDGMNLGRSDVLMVFLTAQSTIEYGENSREFDVSRENKEFDYKQLIAILSRIRNADSPVKLVIVDSGRFVIDPSRGRILNELPRFLAKAVVETGDPNLWVLSSNELFEYSYVSRPLERSVFSLVVELGLKGAADLNRDRHIDVGELFQFVKVMVFDVVKQSSNGAARQTPALFWGGGQQWPKQRSMPILVPVPKSSRDVWRSQDFLTFLNEFSITPVASVFASLPQQFVAKTRRFKRENPMIPSDSPAVPYEAVSDRTINPDELPGKGASTALESGSSSKVPNTPAKNLNQSSSAKATQENEPSANVENDGAKNASPEASKTVIEGAKAEFDQVGLAKLFMEVWGLRDELERDPSSPVNPAYAAPEEWRILQESLLLEERRFRSGAACDQPRIAMVLNTFRDGFQALLRNEMSAFHSTYDRKSSELIDRVRKRMHQRPSKMLKPHSLGFAELLAKHGSFPIEQGLKDVIGQFDRWFTGGSEDEFRDWVEKLDPNHSGLVEIQLARRLAKQTSMSWETKQLALQVCRVAEKTCTMDLRCTCWIASTHQLESDFHAAEELRKGAERTLLDQIGNRRESESRKMLDLALVKYKKVAQDLQDILLAHGLSDRLSRRLPYYVRWHYELGRSVAHRSRISDLFKLTDDLISLVTILDQPRHLQLTELKLLSSKIIRLQECVESGLELDSIDELNRSSTDPSDQFSLEALLATPLPTQSARMTIFQMLGEVDRRNLSLVKMPGNLPNHTKDRYSDLSSSNQEWPIGDLSLELIVPRVGAVNVPGLQEKLNGLELAVREVQQANTAAAANATPHAFESVREPYQNFSRLLRQYYEHWRSEIDSGTNVSLDSLDVSERTRQMVALRAVRRGLQMVPIDLIPADAFSTPTILLEHAEFYDALLWQIQRFRFLKSGSPRQESEDYIRHIQICREQIKKFSRQPLPPDEILPRLRWTGLESVRFDTADSSLEKSSELKLEWLGETKTPVFIRVHFDPELLDVDVGEEDWIHRQTTTSFVEPHLATQMQRALDLQPNRPTDIRLKIRRKEVAARPTRVIVYASNRHETARTDISISFPPQPSTELVINGLRGTWAVGEGKRVELYPFANRNTTYEFSLVNIGAPTPRGLSLKWLAPKNPVSIDMPRTELSADETRRLLDAIGPTDELSAVAEVKLPENATPVKIPFPKMVIPSASVNEVSRPMDMTPHGLIVVMTDQNSGQSLFRSIMIEPQRPRRFVRPLVRYNADRERIEITIVPIDRTLIPPQGVKIRANLLEPLPADAACVLQADLVAPSFEARMFIEVPSSQTEKVVTLQLSVDDYPRAFSFRVPCQNSTGILPTITDGMGIAISSPAGNTAYRAPLDDVAVELQVDAPEGAFQSSGDVIHVGVDRDNDRNFREEPVLSLTQDRQVQTTDLQFGPDGRMNLLTRVGDFRVRVPTTGILNANTQLLARLIVADRTAWSRPVPVTFDAGSPRISQIQLNPPDSVVIEGRLKMTVTATDSDFSGVVKVEAAFDSDRTGQFPVGAKPITADMNAEGKWEALIPTADIKPGQQTLLVRAIDRVGNVGDVTKVKIKFLTAEEMERQNSRPVSVVGTVKYAGLPLSEIRVSAETADRTKIKPVETDENGSFRLSGLTPGKWTVQAKGVVRNKIRIATAELEIKPTEKPQPIQLNLK